MVDFKQYLGNFNLGMLGTTFKIFLYLLPLLIVAGFITWWIYKKKIWNIKVDFKLPRGLNQLKEGEEIDLDEVTGFIGAERGKGSYDPKMGVVWVKRKGLKKSPIKPFNIKRYLQGKNYLTVVQVGSDKYLPVLPQSYVRVADDQTGEEAILLKIRADASESASWRRSFERESKEAYSIRNLLRDYAPIVGVGLILFFNFVGFAILWSKVT